MILGEKLVVENTPELNWFLTYLFKNENMPKYFKQI